MDLYSEEFEGIIGHWWRLYVGAVLNAAGQL